jgi:hypothetical protein
MAWVHPSASDMMRTASLLETIFIFDPLETTVNEDRPRSLYLAAVRIIMSVTMFSTSIAV